VSYDQDFEPNSGVLRAIFDFIGRSLFQNIGKFSTSYAKYRKILSKK